MARLSGVKSLRFRISNFVSAPLNGAGRLNNRGYKHDTPSRVNVYCFLRSSIVFRSRSASGAFGRSFK